MKTFKFEITEILQRTVFVEDMNKAEALKKITMDYRAEKIVLDSKDCVLTDIICLENQSLN